eukprot:m.19172 g.19172  ORF g.19172 m.19172 type:complete len:68 (-) comp5075_c0_seq2:2158-2361(-)
MSGKEKFLGADGDNTEANTIATATMTTTTTTTTTECDVAEKKGNSYLLFIYHTQMLKGCDVCRNCCY